MAFNSKNSFDEKHLADNKKAVEARSDPEKREAFLTEEKVHILKLTSVILKKNVTMSDDEFSIALMAVSEAIDSYDPEKNDFWAYAAMIIRNRLADLYRKESRSKEFSVSPDAIDGNTGQDDPEFAVSLEIGEKIRVKSLGVDRGLKEEMESFEEEIGRYGIGFADLVESSPKSKKTREGCAGVLRLIFMPPPLTELLQKSKKLPVTEILTRGNADRKLMERHRKYLIAATVILEGDYPQLSEYLKYLKPDVGKIINFEERRIGS